MCSLGRCWSGERSHSRSPAPPDADNKAKIEAAKRKKAMVILTAMEQRGHVHSVKANDDPVTDDTGRYFRFGKATTASGE